MRKAARNLESVFSFILARGRRNARASNGISAAAEFHCNQYRSLKPATGGSAVEHGRL
jgi:hypothetical protein